MNLYRALSNGPSVEGQVLDSDRSGGLDSKELCFAMRKLVRVRSGEIGRQEGGNEQLTFIACESVRV